MNYPTLVSASARRIAILAGFLAFSGAITASCDDATPADADISITTGDATDTSQPPDDATLPPGDTATDPGDTSTPPADVTPTSASASGRVYVDENDRAQSRYAQQVRDTLAGVPDLKLTLRPTTGNAKTTTTDANGDFAFDDLATGRYLMSVDIPAERRCNSNNLARRTPAAIDEGALTIVTFGDSLPHYGPAPWFPARLSTILTPFAAITNDNIAVPGSESADWLEGGRHYNTLKSHVPNADLVIFSLGGNDLGSFLNDFIDLDPQTLMSNLDHYLELLDQKILEVAGNLQTIARDVRSRNPTADIVWVVYVNYAWNNYWAPYLGEYAPIVQDVLADKLADIRFYMSRIDDLMLVDLFGAIPGEEIADLMWDELHFNEGGHARTAEELFKLLGGVTVGATAPLSSGLTRTFGLAP